MLHLLKNISLLKKLKPELEILVLYRDLQMAKKKYEEYYRERRKDAIFLRYDLDNLPIIKRVSKKPEKYNIKIYDTNLQDFLEFETDLVVLSTPIVPTDGLEEIAKMLKVPMDKNGFFLEAHVKLRPLDFATDGIFLCGAAQWPKFINETIAQAKGAAARATTILSKEKITVIGATAKVNPDLCIGCGSCQEICPYSPWILYESPAKDYNILSDYQFFYRG